MQALPNHLVLMGFKHAGKSVIGKHLAQHLRVPYLDLDHQIEKIYEQEYGKKAHAARLYKKRKKHFFVYWK